MPAQGAEFYVIVLVGIGLAFFLVGFILTIFFVYQRRRQRQEQEMAHMKEELQQELLRSQLEMQETTLKTIAQELHDNIGQVLSVVKLSMAILPLDKDHAAYEPIQSTRELLNKVIYDMADLTKSLHTDRIAQIGLTEAIRFDLESIKKAGLLAVRFNSSGSEYPFDEQKAIFLFRMYQEMMNNVLKHSKATEVQVSVDYSEDMRFRLRVRDNGVGFDKEKKQKQATSSSGLGLKSMTNRARLIGAEISIQSEPENGTNIVVELPLRTESA